MLLEILIVSVVCNALKVFAQIGHIETAQKLPVHEDDVGHGGQFSNCYEDLGCISTTVEWFHETFRPRNLQPLDRHTIRTQFILINKDDEKGKILKYETLTFKGEHVSIEGYRKDHNAIILIHDFTSNGYTGWVKHMAAAYLAKTGSNIISVDWEAGAEPPFEQAIANARVVGLEVIHFIDVLKGILNPKCIHIVGHGVGAHIAGYVGSAVQVGKISGLDPTGPFFEGMHPVVRLDPGDALFVEVLHTDAFNKRSQGTKQPLGHYDFFINGAKLQPFCNQSTDLLPFSKIDRNTLREGSILPACSHKRAFKYFIESFETTECEFTGFKCQNYNDFIQGKCITCNHRKDNTSCASFGLVNSTTPSQNLSFFLNTHGETPFCLNPYRVIIYIEKNIKSSKQKGNFDMIMLDHEGIMINASTPGAGSPKTFEADKSYALLYYASPPRMNHIVEVRLKWFHKPTKLCLGFCSTSIYVKEIRIKLLSITSRHSEMRFCPSEVTEIMHGSYAVFKQCTKPLPASTRSTPAQGVTNNVFTEKLIKS